MIKEESGQCFPCKRGEHERCNMVLGDDPKQGAVFCSCQCSNTSLGAPPGAFGKVPKRIKRQFPELPSV